MGIPLSMQVRFLICYTLPLYLGIPSGSLGTSPIHKLVWTPCLRFVCIWLYILQNYNYKLHFQNLSIYHIPHAFRRRWHMRREGVIYFYQGFLPYMMSSMDGWRDEWMDEWKASRKTTTASFTICDYMTTLLVAWISLYAKTPNL